jgi:S-adenosylmethionine decarboxylase
VTPPGVSGRLSGSGETGGTAAAFAGPEMTGTGTAVVTQLVIVARGCAGPLPDVPALASACAAAVRDAGFDVVAEAAHTFTPHGASIALLLAQSHVVVSTWPEFAAVLVDLAVCGTREAALQVWMAVEGVLHPGACDVIEHVLDLESAFQARRSAAGEESR